jgi:glycosyltransferase involved in cell wall biosynthesis
MGDPVRVLFLVSGVYPHYMGGVSTWADQLVRGLTEHEFHIVSVVSNPHVEVRYPLPGNVTGLTTVPLWGSERPEEYLPGSLPNTLRRVAGTRAGAIRRSFLPAFETFFREASRGAPHPDRLGEALYAIHVFLREHDLQTTVRSPVLWDAYRTLIAEDPLLSTLDLYEAVNLLRTLARYLRILVVQPPSADLAHAAIASVAGLVGVIAHLERGTRNLLTEHGIYIRERLLDLLNQPLSAPAKVFWQNFHTSLARLNYHYAERIVPVCEFNSRWETRLGVPAAKVQVVPNGVDGARFRPMVLDGAGDGRTIVAVIRVDRLKDTMNLIQSMRHVHAVRPDVRCLIYGPAPDADYARLCVRERARLGLDGCIDFRGFTREPEIAYNLGDVVVMSSISEGFPFALLEGMASGRAVVATDVGGIGEALGDAGLLVPPRQPKALGDAILRLLGDPALRQELGRRGRDRALRQYDVGGFIDAYRSVYQDVGRAA